MPNPTKQQQAAINRLRHDHDFQQFLNYLRAELEDAKAALVDAAPEGLQKLQGKAQAIVALLSVAETQASTPAARTF